MNKGRMRMAGQVAAFLRSLRASRRQGGESGYLASIDPLSGLTSRHAFFQQAVDIFSGLEDTPTTISVLRVDIDRFKSVNEGCGHDAGDAVIRMVARAISNVVRDNAGEPDALISRFGGDEFVILATGLGPTALSELADCLCDAVRASVMWQGDRRITVTISIGLAIAGGGGDVESALHAAEGALHEAKRTGRDRWCVAIPEGAGLAALSPNRLIEPVRKASFLPSAA